MSSVWQSSGNELRASIEKNLLNVEQQRMLRNNNVAVQKIKSEKDARAQEHQDLADKLADKSAKKLATEALKTGKQYALAGSIISAFGTIASTASQSRSGTVNWLTAVPGLLNSAFGIWQAYLDLQKADAEDESIGKDLTRLNSQFSGTSKAMKALDANPYV